MFRNVALQRNKHCQSAGTWVIYRAVAAQGIDSAFAGAISRCWFGDALWRASEAAALQEACDAHLARALLALSPVWAIGIGGFAMKRLQAVTRQRCGGLSDDERARLSTIRLTQILHPSPASPAANRGWQAAIDSSLSELGVYE